MLNSAVLDVVMGMVFVFLIVSLGVTSGNELLASLLKWRAKNLALGIRSLLNAPPKGGLAEEIYQHPLIRGMHRDEGGVDRRKPSYIPARLFAMALLDVALKGADVARSGEEQKVADIRRAILASQVTLGPQVTKVLLSFVDHADADTRAGLSHLEKIQENVEHWFNGSMDRIGGWYKRKTQGWSVALALVLAFAVNVDALRIGRVLSRDPVVRASLIAQATKKPEGGAPEAPAPADPGAETRKAYHDLQQNLSEVSDLGIPIGWGSELSIPDRKEATWFTWWLQKIGGLVLTALAASLGAPFWFDLLQKFIGIRASGPWPEPSRSKAQK